MIDIKRLRDSSDEFKAAAARRDLEACRLLAPNQDALVQLEFEKLKQLEKKERHAALSRNVGTDGRALSPGMQ